MKNARIRIIHESEATGETADLYREIEAHFGLGMVPDIFKLAGSRPEFLRVLWSGYRAMFDGGVLPRQIKEMMATVVSWSNSCQYCTETHSMFLQAHGGTAEAAAAAEAGDIESLPVEEKYRMLLQFAEKVTEHAYRVTDEDFAALRDAGLSDDEIAEGVFVASLFNAINRIADTFGLKEIMQLRESAHQ
jgi:uncharacterized peroxidase-related enzyme